MAFTAAIGTLVQLEDSPGAGTYSTVAQVGGITGPSMKGDKIDTTTHDAANQGYKTFITGLKEGGTVKFPVFHDPTLTSHARLVANFNAGQPENWRVKPPFASSFGWSFAGVVLDLGNKYELNGAAMMDITIEVSGASTLGVLA